MKRLKLLVERLRELSTAIVRYPLTTVFLFAAMIMISISIETEKDFLKEIMSCIIGAVLSASLQALNERFFYKNTIRFFLMGCSVAFTIGYYLIIKSAPELSMEIGIRTFVAVLAMIAVFLWVPVIRSKISFNESFMTAFKSFFHSLLFSAVLFGGCILIIAAIDLLIVSLTETVYPHVANIIFVFFAPIFFLSLIPVYPGERDHKEEFDVIAEKNEIVENAAFCPKFLEVLISYIVIPLVTVFTVILLLYIVLNVREDFWTNNLLEPMLVSYAITVILVYLLASRLENKFAVWFRRIFPKVLVPIMLFQVVSSLLTLREMGITHTRYFTILFGIYAVLAGVVMSLVPIRKNGILAIMLIAFSLVSIIPPVDAFTVSRISQENRLKGILVKNAMLKDNIIIPNALLSERDKKKIVLSVEYLDRMGYTDKITWLPKDFTAYEDFYNTFGFYEYEQAKNQNRFIHVFRNSESAINIKGYDVLVHAFINFDDNRETKICQIDKAGKNYILNKVKEGDGYDFALVQENQNQEIIRFSTQEIFSRYRSYVVEKSELSNEEATFSVENEEAKLTLVVQEANMDASLNQRNNFATLDILISIQ